MALADYYSRSALAIAQILAGFDESAIRRKLEATVLEIVVSPKAQASTEGLSALDLTVRLAARLYPTIRVQGPASARDQVRSLARRINPAIDFTTDGVPTHSVVIGPDGRPTSSRSVYVGSNQWTALLSRHQPQPFGRSQNPFGAGAAACLGMAGVFRSVFTNEGDDDPDTVLRTLPRQLGGRDDLSNVAAQSVLVGAGAVGQGAIWALSRNTAQAHLTIVDPETVDLGNLQRYVLAERQDVGRPKVEVAKRALPSSVTFAGDWASFVEQRGHKHAVVLAALDSAEDRRAVQASLPELVLNAWTQPGDLGVSGHDFIHGACLACLYLPEGQSKNEDVIYAEALGVPEQLGAIRTLLYTGQPVPDPLLNLIADRLHVPHEAIQPFSGRSIRELYREGICGGAVLPIGGAGSPRGEVHVPLAHQSALAGIMLAARMFTTIPTRSTLITRLNVMKSINAKYITLPRPKDRRGICICQDKDYVRTYREKYPQTAVRLGSNAQKRVSRSSRRTSTQRADRSGSSRGPARSDKR